jgi:hypothetical protein
MLLTLAACGSEPTAAEAGETLKTHITKLMEVAAASDVKVTDPGGRDIPCGDGRAKRTYAVIGRDGEPETDPDSLNTRLVGALDRVAHYDITGQLLPGDITDQRPGPTYVRLANDRTKTVLIVESPGAGQYGIRGETECLPIS